MRCANWATACSALALAGYFGVYSSLEIHRDGDAYSHHHDKSLHANPEERRGTLDKAQVDKLMAFLRDLGARDWFSSYYSPVLDGEQWRLFDGRHLRTLGKEASRASVGSLEDASLPSHPPPSRIARGGCGPPDRLRPPWNASPSGASAMKQSSCNKRRSLRASP